MPIQHGTEILFQSGIDAEGQTIHIVGYEELFLTEISVALQWTKLELQTPDSHLNFAMMIKDRGKANGQAMACCYNQTILLSSDASTIERIWQNRAHPTRNCEGTYYERRGSLPHLPYIFTSQAD